MGTGGTDLNLTQSCGNLYQSNLLYHSNGGGSSTFNDGSGNPGMSGGWGDIFQNNIIMDQGGGVCLSPTHTSTNVIVTNNTFLNCARGGIITTNQTGARLNDFSTFTNNVIVNNGVPLNEPGIRVFGSAALWHA